MQTFAYLLHLTRIRAVYTRPKLVFRFPFPFKPSASMANEDSKDLLKNMDWKTISHSSMGDPSGPVMKKRLPKRIRQVPDYYFLPRASLPSTIAMYTAACVAGVGAGMLIEIWIKKKIQEDGGIIWESDKF